MGDEWFWSMMHSILLHMFMMLCYMQERTKPMLTINERYHGITHIEQAEDGG